MGSRMASTLAATGMARPFEYTGTHVRAGRPQRSHEHPRRRQCLDHAHQGEGGHALYRCAHPSWNQDPGVRPGHHSAHRSPDRRGPETGGGNSQRLCRTDWGRLFCGHRTEARLSCPVRPLSGTGSIGHRISGWGGKTSPRRWRAGRDIRSMSAICGTSEALRRLSSALW